MGFHLQADLVDGVGEEHEPFHLLHWLLVRPRWWSRSRARPGLGRWSLHQRWIDASNMLVLAPVC